MCPEEVLICRIFEQAVEDYRELRSKNITQKADNSGSVGSYSIKDIEVFFDGKWCARLLDMINCQFTGEDILNRIKAGCA